MLSIFASVGAITSSLRQTRGGPRRRRRQAKPWCPPATVGATFYGNNAQLDEYEKAVNDMFKDGGKEQGGWIYQNRRGQLKAVRKVREPRDGAMFIYLNNPPPMRGWRVVGTYHTHIDDFGPSGEDAHLVNGVLMASGDFLPNYNHQIPGLVLTRTRDGGIGNYTYGPPPGFFNVGLPAECRSRRRQ